MYVYTAAIADHKKFKLQNLDYFVAARHDEVAHRNLLGQALGAKKPSGLRFQIPAKYLQNGKTVLELGRTLETAFIAAYLGAVKTLHSHELKEVAAQVAANEASHFSFFDAALGGHAVTAALPKSATIPATLKALSPSWPSRCSIRFPGAPGSGPRGNPASVACRNTRMRSTAGASQCESGCGSEGSQVNLVLETHAQGAIREHWPRPVTSR